jgi:tyrosine-protein kinase Etk/Wzc
MNQLHQQPVQAMQDDAEIDLASYLDILFDHRWLIASITLVVTLLGVGYAMMAKPVYEANMVIQIEDDPNFSSNPLGSMSSMFEAKTNISSEIEIIRSRMLASRAVDNLHLNIHASPRHFPLVGAWLAGRNKKLSEPGLFGYGGYAWGAEKIDVSVFAVPPALEGLEFVLTTQADGQYTLTQSDHGIELKGSAGATLESALPDGAMTLRVERLAARPGAQFLLRSSSRVSSIQNLQAEITVAEKGKQSGTLGITLKGWDPELTSRILNEIGHAYVNQNVEQKSEEVEKSLALLDKQLPEVKLQLEQSQAKFKQFRKDSGSIDLTLDGTLLLGQSVAAQTKLAELKQERKELLARFMANHPLVTVLDRQSKEIDSEMQSIEARIKTLPLLEQNALRLTREVKINAELYADLLDSAQQLRRVKTGNVRMIDTAVTPKKPVNLNHPVIAAISALLGMLLGVMCAFIRKSLFGGISDAHEIEQALGLTVYASIPYSKGQAVLQQKMPSMSSKVSVLAQIDPSDMAIESLRSLRTSLQFLMRDARNNIVLITGPTPRLGQSFISVNFAAVLGLTGKKVLLLDADLRKGHLNQCLGLERENGFSDLVAGTCSLELAVHKNVLANVDFISTGSLPPNPSELLLDEKTASLLAAFSEAYDYVLIDTPPLLAVSDAMILSFHAGAVFMVARAGQSNLSDIKESVKRCSQAGMQVNGVILNGITHRPGGGGHGKYRYIDYNY